MDNSITKKQLTTLALIGLLILVLFAAGIIWLYYGDVDVPFTLAEFFVFYYVGVINVYVGFFTASFAKSRGKPAWLWGIAGFALTLFAGPVIFAFFAPVLLGMLIVLLISIPERQLFRWSNIPLGLRVE
jgi:hypothetical protein